MLGIVKAWVEQHNLLTAEDHILAACSGGPDSVALVHILAVLKNDFGYSLSVAHVDHMLRGIESEQDAEFVASFCKELGLPLYQAKISVPQYCQDSGLSVQEGARKVRFEFLRKIAGDLGGAVIATGHHRDDQAETVLINLFRGAGSSGLKGMRPKENGIIRPLLAIGRSDIEEYCRLHRLASRTDCSNLKTDYLRNRVRLELFPYLTQNYNPNIIEALWRSSQIAADEYAYIRQQAETAGVIRQEKQTVIVNREKLRQEARALRREIIRLAIEITKGDLKGISFEHVERLVEMAVQGRVGALLPLPGNLTVRVGYDSLEIARLSDRRDDTIELSGVELCVPGATPIPELGIRVVADLHRDNPLADGGTQAVFDWDVLEPPLIVRTRAAGDRFRPLGMSGTKKLKDYFIDEKIPRDERASAPVICDTQGIIWIGGYRQSDRGKISGNTKNFLRLSIDKQEDTQHV